MVCLANPIQIASFSLGEGIPCIFFGDSQKYTQVSLHQSEVNQNEVLTLHRCSLILPRLATTMWSPASSCRSLPPPLIILLPPRQVWVTTATTTRTKRTSRRRKLGRTLMEEDDDDPMTAWHWIGGSRRHRTSDKRGRGGRGFHIQQSTKNQQR